MMNAVLIDIVTRVPPRDPRVIPVVHEAHAEASRSASALATPRSFNEATQAT